MKKRSWILTFGRHLELKKASSDSRHQRSLLQETARFAALCSLSGKGRIMEFTGPTIHRNPR